MSVFAGVDGGGTRTRAVLVDEEGRELSRAEHDGAVVTAAQPEDAAEAVRAALARAADEAGLSLPVDVLWAGLAGAGAATPRAAVTRALRRHDLADRLIVGTDVEAAFHDAFGQEPGVLLIAGTGSIAWARGADGVERRVGGWGRMLGDEGSGYWIGMEGLRHLTRVEDGRRGPTPLRDALLDRCGVESVEELVGWVEEATKSEVASLAPVVVDVADRGDSGAGAIVEAAVDHLVDLVMTAVRAAGDAGDADSGSGRRAEAEVGGRDAGLVLWGGLVAPGGPLRDRLTEALRESGVRAEDRSVDPPMGAARLARASVRG